MKNQIVLLPALLLASSCASVGQSLVLGGASGAALGAYTGSAVYPGPKTQVKTRNILMGAGIGLGVGLLTSYLIHGHVEGRVSAVQFNNDERLRFGDLPPNPFSPDLAVPPINKRKR